MGNAIEIREPYDEELIQLPEIENRAALSFEIWAKEHQKEVYEFPESSLSDLLKSEKTLVAVLDNKVIGFVVYKLYPQESAIYIEELDVDFDYQGHKIGVKLVNDVIDRHEKFKQLALTTYSHIPWNAPYYEKNLSFKIVQEDEIPNFMKVILEKEKSGDLPEPEKRVVMIRDMEP